MATNKGVQMEKILLIDFENIQNINLEQIEKLDYRIYLFIGESQTKVPMDLFKSGLKLCDKLKIIQIEGNGTNALDFHIAYHLGNQIEKDHNNEYIILSKDKGFDPLVRFIKKQNVRCKRINGISEIVPSRINDNNNEQYIKVLENLKKIEKAKRPRKINTMKQHIKTLFGKTLTDKICNEIIDQLFIKRIISEENGRLIYEKTKLS
jgi:hypothetical protein